MKKSNLYLIFLICFTSFSNAQTLTFSQVLLVGNTAQTVPTGKVWKVESYLLNNSTTVNNSAGNCVAAGTNPGALFIVAAPGGATYNFMYRPVQANPSSSGQWGFGATFPFWLPAGSQLASNCASWYLSVIEFSINP